MFQTANGRKKAHDPQKQIPALVGSVLFRGDVPDWIPCRGLRASSQGRPSRFSSRMALVANTLRVVCNYIIV